MKLLKAFKFFESDPSLLAELQNKASAVIQEDKITGTLCFSVHPLDFLSSSENNHNWRSCHALDGEYRAGNLSYMVDECTFLCYLKSEGETILPNFPDDVPWNNKKWRTLLFINDNKDMMFAGRQYPFSSEYGIEYVKNLLSNLPGFGKWTEWRKDKIRSYSTGIDVISFNSPYIGVGNKLIPLKTLVKDANPTYPLHFNDILKSSCYDPMYSYKYVDVNSWYTGSRSQTVTTPNGRFIIGGNVKCLCCNNTEIDMTEIMTCTECELKYGSSDSESFAYCGFCGRRFVYDDGTFVDMEDEMVCPSCAENHIAECACCNRTGYIGTDVFYDSERYEYYCEECSQEED